jgi:EAL domain-containing protein (putative c-di-GMP-specific phosphodiesterase class I)/GGDEF domain-containing protein
VAVLAAQYALQINYPIASGLGTICLVVAGCVTRDIVRRFRMQSQTDEMTLLPNRSAFTHRSFAQPVDVAVVQIDNLDAIAAVLGPQELGNALIRTAERLKLASVDHQVYRVRGHHLAYVVAVDEPLDDAMAGLRAILRQPVEVNGRRIDVLTSVGVANGTDPASLLTDAALAAEQAQSANTFWRQSVANRSKLERSLSLMSDLEDAMAAGHIEVFYQPKLSLSTDRVTSVEALVRWRDPERGFIGPDQFIPMAEQTGRIQALTLHIIAIVLRDASHWRSLGYHMTAGINISATLLTSKAFNNEVEALLARSSVSAGDLIFEVTESAAMDDQEAAVVALRRYRDLGVAVSMDDYGTGQSTLSYIQLLPLSELKIDRSFVQFAHQNTSDAILVQSTIDLAHRLGIKVVAEGIEDEACLQFLRANRCDLAQGYHISRPVPFADLLRFIGDAHEMAA